MVGRREFAMISTNVKLLSAQLLLHYKPALKRDALSASDHVVTFVCVGSCLAPENVLDQIVGMWFLQGVSSYSGVDLCFLVDGGTVVLRSRLDGDTTWTPTSVCAVPQSGVCPMPSTLFASDGSSPATTIWYGADPDSLPMMPCIPEDQWSQ